MATLELAKLLLPNISPILWTVFVFHSVDPNLTVVYEPGIWIITEPHKALLIEFMMKNRLTLYVPHLGPSFFQ